MEGDTEQLMESGESGGDCKYSLLSAPAYSGNVLLDILTKPSQTTGKKHYYYY